MDINSPSTNPLAKHFRQPSIYFKLPSGGRFWKEGAVTLPPNGEVGVMSMTTKDEITLRTPDALMNGQGVVDVIQSCCPSIHDAWGMPGVDVDATLIAIRIASYGNQMDFTSKCPHCETESDYAIDLGRVLTSVKCPDFDTQYEVEGLIFTFKPQMYFELNKTNQIGFEEQQVLRALSNLEDNPEESKRMFDLHLQKVIDLNVNLLSSSTESIGLPDGTLVTEHEYIREFYINADSKLTRGVQKALNTLSRDAGLPPVDVTCNNDQCSKQFPVDITFDYASFFGIGS